MEEIVLAPRILNKPIVLEKEEEIDFQKEMEEIDKFRDKIFDCIEFFPEPVIKEEMTTEEKMKKMARQKAMHYANIDKERKERNKIIDEESDKLAKRIFNTLKNCTDEEISNLAVLSLNNDDKLNKIASIYVVDTKKKGEDYIEPIKVAREALNKVLREAKTRIEIKHSEFPRVAPVKRMKL